MHPWVPAKQITCLRIEGVQRGSVRLMAQVAPCATCRALFGHPENRKAKRPAPIRGPGVLLSRCVERALYISFRYWLGLHSVPLTPMLMAFASLAWSVL